MKIKKTKISTGRFTVRCEFENLPEVLKFFGVKSPKTTVNDRGFCQVIDLADRRKRRRRKKK